MKHHVATPRVWTPS